MALTKFKQIEKWNRERNLIKAYNHKAEVSFIIEELIESTSNMESKKARKYAKVYTWFLLLFGVKTTKEQMVDAFCDIIVFATGAIIKLGYNPDKAMTEVMKELNDRSGTLVDGKFIKDVKEDAYKADFSKAKDV